MFNAFAEGLRPMWPAGINTIEKPKFNRTVDWLLAGNYIWLSAINGVARLQLPFGHTGFSSALANEIARFSCAAYESLIDATPTSMHPQAIAWPLVRGYYATFYCSHALLRISGCAITFISGQEAQQLNTLGGQYLGVSPQISRGLHSVFVDPTNTSVIVLKKISAGQGGSHEDMWKLFLVLMTDIEDRMLQLVRQVPSAASAVQISIRLRSSLSNAGNQNGAWASTVRNAINYKHDYGIWFPYAKNATACNKITANMKRWHPSTAATFTMNPTSDDLMELSEISNVVTHILTSTLSDISRRSPRKGKSFVDRYPFKLLRERKILMP